MAASVLTNFNFINKARFIAHKNISAAAVTPTNIVFDLLLLLLV